MERMKSESPDMTAQNIDRIAALFPSCVTEALDEEHSTPEKKVYKRTINTESDAPKREHYIEQPEKPAEKRPVFTPETESEQLQAEPQVPKAAVLEKSAEKPTPKKKPFPFVKLIVAVLAVIVIARIALAELNHSKRQSTAYEEALQSLTQGDYFSAEEGFSSLSNYRDAASLATYCKYAEIYDGKTEYAGGQDELSKINLQYDTGLQKDVDALESRVKGYKAEKDAAEEAERERIAAEDAAKREQSLKEQYSGKLPVEGMPMSCLKYTSLGKPDKTEKCFDFDRLVEEKRSYSVYWYDSEGRIQAAGECFKGKHYEEYMLISFSYYDYST